MTEFAFVSRDFHWIEYPFEIQSTSVPDRIKHGDLGIRRSRDRDAAAGHVHIEYLPALCGPDHNMCRRERFDLRYLYGFHQPS
jgi:hypothetical protein